MSVFSLRINDRYLKTEVTVENIWTGNLDDVRFMRSIDPDNTVDVTYAAGIPLHGPDVCHPAEYGLHV